MKSSFVALLLVVALIAGCKKKEPPFDPLDCCNVVVGYKAGTMLKPGMHHDTMIGAYAEVGPGLSYVTEIGPGVCYANRGVCINGVPTDIPIISGTNDNFTFVGPKKK